MLYDNRILIQKQEQEQSDREVGTLASTVSSGDGREHLFNRARHQAATITGLESFDTPTLEAVERRRLQLWLIALMLLGILATAVVSLGFVGWFETPDWVSRRQLQVGLVVIVGLFAVYALEKELQLRNLARLLVQEKVLTATLTHRLSMSELLLEAAKTMNQDLAIDEVLDTILRCAREILAGHDGSIMLVQGGQRLKVVCVSGPSAAEGMCLEIGEGVAGRVAATGEAVLISGTLSQPDRKTPVKDGHSPQSALSVPLIHRGDLLGVLNINAQTGVSYTEHELRALKVFGEQAATAIANAQLYETQRLRTSQAVFESLHDSLTNLPNRNFFLQRVENALEHEHLEGEQLALLFVDVDAFKRVNDHLGHAAGDEALRLFADRLHSCLSPDDTVARMGGDEFAVLLKGVSSEAEALATARRVLTAVSGSFDLHGTEVTLSASIGVALLDLQMTGSELMRFADAALHVAKSEHRGTVELFDPSMDEVAKEFLDLQTRLPQALARGELEVYFQPIVDMRDGKVVNLEALVRWHHPTRGLLPASTFVGVAESDGLLVEIDRWVLERACERLQTVDNTTPELGLHVNLSARSLLDPEIVKTVSECLASREIEPTRLTLEVTERATLRRIDTAKQNLNRLKSSGIQIALDDFGTGYSSLSYLHELPVDTLKIDRVFVQSLATSSDATALIEAILRLGQSLKLRVIAEGIERSRVAETLQGLGCRFGQGALYGKAVPWEELSSV
ncbi:MAG: EAL domain-containing protein [Thermoanaerobaculia bacterium]